MEEKSEKMNKNDFVEIEFTGKIKDGDIFDSNIKKDLEKTNLKDEDLKKRAKPFVFCLGHEMFLKAIDEFLIGKETGKEYEIELAPEKAFGKREPKLIKIIPTKVFLEKQINPQKGMVFNFDNQLGKVISISGGRIITDFNNPLAGKVVEYKIKVLRKLNGVDKKIKALMDFFFKKEFKFEIKDKKIVVMLDDKSKQFRQFIELFKDKFKEILGLELEVEAIEEKKKDEGKQTQSTSNSPTSNSPKLPHKSL